MGIKQDMEKMFNVKKVKGEYATNKEYREYRRSREDYILEEWENKLEKAELDLQERRRYKPPYEILEDEEKLKNIDKKFCMNIEEFYNKYMADNSHKDLDKKPKIIESGLDIIYSFIIERFKFLINSDMVAIPDCKGEPDTNRWFQENCNNLGFIIVGRHSKSHKGSNDYSGIDYICKFVDSDEYGPFSCNDNYYCPRMIRYMTDNQIQAYRKFLEFIDAGSLVIEIEHLSSNFIRHRHPKALVNMIVCYKKDKELSIPILDINIKDNHAQQ